jgi:hypothetical protein
LQPHLVVAVYLHVAVVYVLHPWQQVGITPGARSLGSR